MNLSVAVGLLLVLFMGMVLAAGFAAGDMPNNLKGLNARRDTAAEAFWFFTGWYVLFALIGVAFTIANWGK